MWKSEDTRTSGVKLKIDRERKNNEDSRVKYSEFSACCVFLIRVKCNFLIWTKGYLFSGRII